MTLEYEATIEPEYVLLICKGLIDVDAAVEVFTKAAELASAEKPKAALVDIRGMEFELPTTLGRFDLGCRVAEALLRYGVRLAVLGEEPPIDPERFGETVAVNRGARLRVFTDFEAARSWLGALRRESR